MVPIYDSLDEERISNWLFFPCVTSTAFALTYHMCVCVVGYLVEDAMLRRPLSN